MWDSCEQPGLDHSQQLGTTSAKKVKTISEVVPGTNIENNTIKSD